MSYLSQFPLVSTISVTAEFNLVLSVAVEILHPRCINGHHWCGIEFGRDLRMRGLCQLSQQMRCNCYMVYTSEREDLVNRCQARRQNLGPSEDRLIVSLNVDAEIEKWLLVHKSVYILSICENQCPGSGH